MSRARLRTVTRALDALRRRLNPPKIRTVVAFVPGGASVAEMAAILDAAEARLEALDPRPEGEHQPTLRVALQGDPDDVDVLPEEPEESEAP